MTQFHVTDIFRYPVKSMLGERLTETSLNENGIPFDRGWAIRDEKTGNITGAKRFGDLMKCSARYLEGTDAGLVPHVEIKFPDDRTINSDDDRVHDVLSRFLNRAVTLWPLQPAEDKEHYQNKSKNGPTTIADMRGVLGLLPEDPMPDFSNFPKELLGELTKYTSPLGTYFDAYPLSLLTKAAMRKLEDMVPNTRIGAERFRPNIVLDDDEKLRELVEFEWVGKTIELGGVEMSADLLAPRCVMVTREQPGYERASQIVRALVKQTKHSFSIYASITKNGTVKVGDTLAIR